MDRVGGAYDCFLTEPDSLKDLSSSVSMMSHWAFRGGNINEGILGQALLKLGCSPLSLVLLLVRAETVLAAKW